MVERQLPKLHTRVRFPSPAAAFALERSGKVKPGASAEALREGGFIDKLRRASRPSMYYVYLLRSESHPKQPYVGLTRDLIQRMKDHSEGRSPHTKKFRPWILVAYFAFAQEKMAIAFEKYLKSASGRAFIKPHFS
jgi:putative endonuclease